MSIIILRGSWGNLKVHRATGHIVAYDDEGNRSDEDVGYSDILYILPETLRPGLCECLDKHGETDILCVGFVDDKGGVTDPMHWSHYEEMLADPVALMPAPISIRPGRNRAALDLWAGSA